MLNVVITDPDITLPELPEVVASHPGMISRQERQLLYGLARDHYEGRGQIIDAGAFLGASTVAFTLGLHHGNRLNAWKGPGKPIISYERAIVEPYYLRHAKKHNLATLEIDDTFEPLLRELTADYTEHVDLQIGDVLTNTGAGLVDIEICFLDILKTPAITQHCLKLFFPRLLVGAYIIHQDYFYQDLPYIKVTMEGLMDNFRYLGEVRSSAVFQMTKPIDNSMINKLYEMRSIAEQLKLHMAAEDRTTDNSRKYLMMLSRALLLANLGDANKAKSVWQEADSTYPETAFKEDGSTYQDNISWRLSKLKQSINCALGTK